MKIRRRPSLWTLLPGLLSGLLLFSCGQLPDHRNFKETDLRPPVLLQLVPRDEQTLVLHFDKELGEDAELKITPDLSVSGQAIIENRLEIQTDGIQIPGKKYFLEGRVRDLRGNTLSFLYSFYGHNPSPPRMLINEFTTQGSASHPDMVELRVMEGGNCAGMMLCEGTSGAYKDHYIFPSVDVKTGDYLLVHFKPQGIPEEIDETGGDLGESGGLDAAPQCRDFWVAGGDGLPGNNGIIALYAYPQGPLADAVFYSNRTSSSDTKYRGFGSQEMMSQADQLHTAGGWKAQNSQISPEDGIDPSKSTATRSLCRNSRGDDSDTAADWHTVPTGAYSFGRENSDESYSP